MIDKSGPTDNLQNKISIFPFKMKGYGGYIGISSHPNHQTEEINITKEGVFKRLSRLLSHFTHKKTTIDRRVQTFIFVESCHWSSNYMYKRWCFFFVLQLCLINNTLKSIGVLFWEDNSQWAISIIMLFYDHLLYAKISIGLQKCKCTSQMHVVKQSFNISQRFL